MMNIDFPLILVIVVLGSGAIWLLDALLLAGRTSVPSARIGSPLSWARGRGLKGGACFQRGVSR
jgi:hypothetical protein